MTFTGEGHEDSKLRIFGKILKTFGQKNQLKLQVSSYLAQNERIPPDIAIFCETNSLSQYEGSFEKFFSTLNTWLNQSESSSKYNFDK